MPVQLETRNEQLLADFVVVHLCGPSQAARLTQTVPLDSLVFGVLAFGALPFLADDALTLPWSAVWDIVLVNIVVKGLVTLVSLPLIYVAPDRNWDEID